MVGFSESIAFTVKPVHLSLSEAAG